MRQIDYLRQKLDEFIRRLQLRDPEFRLREQAQRVDELEGRLLRVWSTRERTLRASLQASIDRLQAHTPTRQIGAYQKALTALNKRNSVSMLYRHRQAAGKFDILARALNGVSPLAVMDRGYAIVTKNDKPITNISKVQTSDELTTRLSDGDFVAVVKTIKPHTT